MNDPNWLVYHAGEWHHATPVALHDGFIKVRILIDTASVAVCASAVDLPEWY